MDSRGLGLSTSSPCVCIILLLIHLFYNQTKYIFSIIGWSEYLETLLLFILGMRRKEGGAIKYIQRALCGIHCLISIQGQRVSLDATRIRAASTASTAAQWQEYSSQYSCSVTGIQQPVQLLNDWNTAASTAAQWQESSSQYSCSVTGIQQLVQLLSEKKFSSQYSCSVTGIHQPVQLLSDRNSAASTAAQWQESSSQYSCSVTGIQ